MKTQRQFNISAVERETGLSKDVLRKWELRYGFPQPIRSEAGERRYPDHQVTRLRLMKRLMDTGLRPSELIALDDPALTSLAASRALTRSQARGDEVGAFVTELRRHDVGKVGKLLRSMLLRHGAKSFVLDFMPALNEMVGEAWANGEIQVFEEHLYTEIIQGLVREAITTISVEDGRPRVLLTTPPGEAHTLGILMVEMALSLHGAKCIGLGPQTPLTDIAQAARALHADLVGLSFSVVYPARQIVPCLAELRSQLPEHVGLWAGGAGTARRGKLPAGVKKMVSLDEAVAQLDDLAHW